MEFDWDEDKAIANRAKHGVEFELVYTLDWSTLVVRPDARHDYGEERWQALSRERRVLIVFAVRNGIYRIISVRKVHSKEIRQWARLKRS